jgi:hypothetical protein
MFFGDRPGVNPMVGNSFRNIRLIAEAPGN